MTEYTNKSDWDARQSYFETLADAHKALIAAAGDGDLKGWFTLLDQIHSQYAPGWSQTDYDSVAVGLEEVFNILYPRAEGDDLPDEIRNTVAFEKIRTLQKKMNKICYDSGQLAPLRMDANHAVARSR
jgi:hypothetical protein